MGDVIIEVGGMNGISKFTVRATTGRLMSSYAYLVGSYYQPYVEISDDNGASWGTKTAIISPATSANEYRASLAIDSRDNVHAVWRDYTNGKIRYSKYNGSSWSAPVDIKTGLTNPPTPVICVNSSDHICIVYSGASTALYCKISTDGGGSWSAEKTIDATSPSLWPDLCANGADFHVVYYRSDGSVNHIYYSKYTSSWSAGSKISDYSTEQIYPSIAIDKNGDIHVAWTGKYVGATSYRNVRYRKYTGGAWQSIVNVTSEASNDTYFTTIQVTEDVYVNIFYRGYDSGTGLNKIRRAYYNGVTWAMSTVSGTGDGLHHSYPGAVYQSTPLNCRISSGWCIGYFTEGTYNARYIDSSSLFSSTNPKVSHYANSKNAGGP